MIDIAAVNARLDELANLEHDWDSYGADPIHPRALARARRLVELISPFLGAPFISPLCDGGIDIEWVSDSIEVSLEVTGTDEGVIYMVNGVAELERLVPMEFLDD